MSDIQQHPPLQGEELERFNQATKTAKAISKHEFNQDIIDLCDPLIDASENRIAMGLNTREEEEIAIFLELKKILVKVPH